jgi:phosphonate transport system ATP-binding protein
MTGPVFVLADVSKTFGARKALDSVDLSVGPGEFLALIGPSGSGKSTLLRTLNGLVTIDPGPGAVRAFGEVLQARGRVTGDRRAVRMRTGFVFQQFNLVGRLSLFTNVMIGAIGRLPAWRGLLGLWPPEDRARALAALDRVGVRDYAAQRANTLSGGQQQRGAIARALLQGAEALLADEPVASLDPASSRRVMEILEQLNRKDGLTVVVTLHQVDHALRYCRRIVALKAGKVVFDGRPEALDRAALHEIYGAEVEEVLSPAPILGAGA